MAIDFQPMQQSDNTPQQGSIDFQPIDNQQSSQEQLVNSQPNVNPGMNMPGFNPEQVDSATAVSPQMSANPVSSDFNIGDMAALSFLDKPEDQQNYLQKKFPYVIPQGQGNYMVGQSPGTVKPINVTGSNNGFFGWLASQADQIPSMVGMGLGAAAGTAIAPGPGTVAGAGLGAAAGEAVSKGIGAMEGSTDSLIKDGVDTAISGAFGAVGQKAAQMFGLAAGKIIAPNLAKAVDAKLTSMVNSGKDPSGFINFVASAVHFASGANKDDVSTLLKYGVDKTLSDPAVNNKNAIINIAQDIINKVKDTKSSLGQAVGSANLKLLRNAGGEDIQNSPIFDYVKKEMEAHPGWGTVDGNILTLNRNAANSADSNKFGELLKNLGATPIRTTSQAPKTSELLRMAQDQADNLQYNINNPTHQAFIEKTLGLQPGDIANELDKSATGAQEFSTGGPKAFKIPVNGKINVKQAVGIQQDFGQLTDEENSPLSDDMRRVFTNILYRDGSGNDSPLVAQLSKVAKDKGIDEWTASKNAYKNFMQSIDGKMGVNKLGLDITSPKSIQDFATHINSKQPVDTQILSNFENNIGEPVLDNLRKYGAIHNLENFQPNFLRLGMVSGLLGGMIGGGDLATRVGRGMGFGLLIPGGLKLGLKGIESGSNVGANVLKSITSNSLKNRVGTTVASQKGATLLRNLINNSGQQ